MPRKSSTTKAWKWKYSRLFSRKRWKSTSRTILTTRKHNLFDLEQPPEIEMTTSSMMVEQVTTEQFKVLSSTHPPSTAVVYREQVRIETIE
jgi:hypothetical protein